MCNPFEAVVEAVEDVVEVVVNVVEDVIGWLIPQPEIPDYGENQVEQTARGVLVNKINANAHIPIGYGT